MELNAEIEVEAELKLEIENERQSKIKERERDEIDEICKRQREVTSGKLSERNGLKRELKRGRKNPRERKIEKTNLSVSA